MSSYLRDKHDPPEGSLGDDLIDGHDDHEIRIQEIEKVVSKQQSEIHGLKVSRGHHRNRRKENED